MLSRASRLPPLLRPPTSRSPSRWGSSAVRPRGVIGWWLGIAVFLAACWLLFFSAASALAAEYTQPTTPFSEPTFGSETPACEAVANGSYPSGESVTVQLLWGVRANTLAECQALHTDESRVSKRLFWVTDEVIRSREATEAVKTEVASLKTELVKALGTEGTIAKDLTKTEGLPVELHSSKSGFYAPVEVLGSSSVKVSSLPELPTGTKALGSVKVSELQGEPAIKALQDGTWKDVGAALEGTSPVKCTEGCSGGGGSGEVKVSNEPDKPQLEVVQADETAAKDVAETAGENDREALWFLGGVVVALVIGFAIYRQGSIRA